MIKYLGNKQISFDIEDVVKGIDVDKVAFINDASENMKNRNDTYAKYVMGFSIAPFSRHIFKEDLPQVILDFIESLGFTEYGCNLLIQQTGECSPNHFDLFLYQVKGKDNKTKEDYYRYFIFLNDRTIGQFYHIGDKQLDWKTGDMYYQDCNEYHGAGNIGKETRYTIIIDSLKSLHPFSSYEVTT